MTIDSELMEESVFGDYKIIKKIRENVWSTNFLAEHRFLKKKYILHVLHSYLLKDNQFMSSFKHFIAKVVFLDHPCILKIENVSEIHGIYFFVTQFLEDKVKMLSLTQYLFGRQDLLLEEEVFTILSQLASVLDYVHEEGFSYFSLLPDSILINSSELKVQVVTTHFGMHDLFVRSSLLSYLQDYDNMDLFFRSVAFLSPEQKINSNNNEYSDTYSFGVLAYFLLFKKFPEGFFPMPSKVFPNYNYDWDFLLTSCLSHDCSLRSKNLSSLLKRKEEINQQLEIVHDLLQDSEKEYKNLRSLDLNIEERPLIKKQHPQFSEIVENKNTSQLETNSLQVENNLSTTQNFILVSPCSIDESIINISINDSNLDSSPDANKDKDDILSHQALSSEYSQALHSMLNKDPVVSHYHLKKNIDFTPKPLLTEMVLIQGNNFSRGSTSGNRDENPKHMISLNSFFMDIHPVTNEQYLRFLDFIGGEQDENCNDLIRLKESRIQRRAGTLFIEPGYNKHPVVGVTWYGAVNYASWIGKRLPTEAEWEIAAKGGTEDNEFPTGNEINKAQANFFSSDTTPVMMYPCNVYGLYDMAGNVYEWCQDWYSYNYYETSSQEPHDPKGPLQGVYRVLRGGCWKSLKLDLRCSHRHRNNPGTVNSTYGFRCALDVR